MTSMPEDEARYHLKRCIDSGLWIPDAKKAEQNQQAEASGGKESSGEYETVGESKS